MASKGVARLRDAAVAIADAATTDTRGDDAVGLSLSEALAALERHATEARQTRNGRELTLFESEPARVGRLVDFLIGGNYRETAATLAGITPRAVRLWMQRAEEGDPRFEAVAQVIQIAEALAEHRAIANVQRAGVDPRLWAASMTYLERRHPDRWGRRTEATFGPAVLVQVGIQSADVSIAVGPSPAAPTDVPDPGPPFGHQLSITGQDTPTRRKVSRAKSSRNSGAESTAQHGPDKP